MKNTSTLYPTGNVTATISKEFSSNGDTSFKIEFQGNGINWNNIDLFRLFPNNFESGNYTLKLTAYKNINPIQIVLFNETNVSVVTLPSINDASNITLTGEISNENYVSCRIITQNTSSCYFDEISLSIQ